MLMCFSSYTINRVIAIREEDIRYMAETASGNTYIITYQGNNYVVKENIHEIISRINILMRPYNGK